METKKDLAKVALAALLLASTAEASSQLADMESHEVILAISCAAHGCPSTPPPKGDNSEKKEEIADSRNTRGDVYNTRSNTYQTGSSYSHQPYQTETNYPINPRQSSPSPEYQRGVYDSPPGGSTPSETTSPYGYPRGYDEGYSKHSARDSAHYSSYNVNRTGPTNPVYVDTYEYERAPSTYPKYGYGTTHLDREYNTVNDYDFNRSSVTTTTSSGTLTEAQLLALLNPQGRAIYLSLDPEAKALAIQIASQDSYRDKNLAVKEAQRRMNDRRGMLNR